MSCRPHETCIARLSLEFIAVRLDWMSTSSSRLTDLVECSQSDDQVRLLVATYLLALVDVELPISRPGNHIEIVLLSQQHQSLLQPENVNMSTGFGSIPQHFPNTFQHSPHRRKI